MRVVNEFTSVFALLMLMSCVTINIYFPEAAAEKAADRSLKMSGVKMLLIRHQQSLKVA